MVLYLVKHRDITLLLPSVYRCVFGCSLLILYSMVTDDYVITSKNT
jgi:hypothetical protein